MDYGYFDILDDYDYEMEQIPEPAFYDWEQEFWACMVPHTNQILKFVGALMCAVFCCRFGWIVVESMFPRLDWLPHFVSFICGSALVLVLDIWNLVILVAFSGLGYTCLRVMGAYRIPRKKTGFIMIFICIGGTMTLEFALNDPSMMQAVRSYIMVCSMKLVSLGFDEKMYDTVTPWNSISEPAKVDLLAYLGYIFCPSTVMSGPWLSYKSYECAVKPSSWGPMRRKSVMWGVVCLVISLTTFNFSNCILPKIYINDDFTLLRAFRDALSVRCDHYVMLFLAQSGCTLNGFLQLRGEVNAYMGHMLTRPWEIEFPRSLATVVRNWNIPMYHFLKTYIYKEIHAHITNNYFAATVLTFMVSALMHGFHLKVYMVLISLVFFSYVEYQLREELARIFNYCITANPCRCRPSKKFKYCPKRECCRCNACIARTINFMFTLANMLCLAYLGVMMSQGEMSPEEMNDLSPTKGWHRWAEMKYGAHWGALFLYIIYLVVSLYEKK